MNTSYAMESNAAVDASRFHRISFFWGVIQIVRRELHAFFATPIAYVLLVIFLVLLSVLVFQLGLFFEREQADLAVVFQFLPWIMLVFVPAITMRVWSEELRSGAVEVLMTLPISSWVLIVGKFLASWVALSVALVTTTPYWAIVAWLGEPDHGEIFSGYLGAFFLGGVFTAVGCAFSAMTTNQVIAFVGSLAFLVFISGADSPLVLDTFAAWGWDGLRTFIAQLGLLSHYFQATRGVLSLYGLVSFFGYMVVFLTLNWAMVERIRR